ncbi:co-chaperone GroES [Halarcobacter bivalviorum]|uniref:Co-chaperonin GroES n=1 Tax=Halarcobacter bivalviorum TaxID=663364 RepID=A0AAX2A4N8_9BACT|nr:co-chaperone GroES [Halarcobacter bivalviorum]AXH11554.1 10 kD chaperonin (cpn10) [Halarcobacter bivalviorum]RXK02871.1 co-chaperone GroES [Halarcobacter bivalviorum]RXK08880.1 co-chaperone GroES [Halarcobacter bivalviorum]
MNFKPLGKRVLAQRTEVEEKTASGIILVDSAKEKPNTAKVIAVGSEVSELKEGDIIVFEQYRGSELSLEGEDYLVLDIENIIGVM